MMTGARAWSRASRRALAAATAALLLVVGGHGVARAQLFEPAWSGTTSEGEVVSFTVVNAAITSAAFGFSLSGIGCPPGGSIALDLSSAPVGISGNTFSVEGTQGGFSLAFSGFFLSPVEASGSLVVTSAPSPSGPQCASSVSWTASAIPPVALLAAVLPSSRSVLVGEPATAFATVLNPGAGPALGCRISPPPGVRAIFAFQTTNPANNLPTGAPNAPADIPGGEARTFVIAFTPTEPIGPADLALTFACANVLPAASLPGINTLLLSASPTPVPDLVALAVTATGTGIVEIPGLTGTGAFAVAAVNLGAGATITASADTGSVALPVDVRLCETDPASGACTSAVEPTVTTAIGTGATPSFGVFVTGTGLVSPAPGVNRIFVRFTDQGGVVRGSTSVAVQTQ